MPAVELDSVASVSALLEVLVDCALNDLPDAASFIEIDLEEGLAAHQIDLKRVEVGERPAGDHLSPLLVEVRHVSRQVARGQDRPPVVADDVMHELHSPLADTDDVVVGAAAPHPIAAVRQFLLTVGLFGEVETPDYSAPCQNQLVSKLIFVEELAEQVLSVEGLVEGLLKRQTVLLVLTLTFSVQ
ncbi:MAG: hypothetical protein JWM00_88 [Candidatus Saccharibacteria bacterium]|nr:hypothetical protein [Candidatus Saccharibacteria bacterium]